MKIIRLQTQGFKRVVAVDITPSDPLVEVRGNNAEGKSSLLDSIKAGLAGASAAPIKPIRTGDDFAAIRIELGDNEPAIIVEKYFDEVGEKLKVTTADGYKATQTDVDKLLGRMTFDPLAFARLNAADQAVELRRLVPLKVDLDQLAAADKADTLARRDVNRDAKTLKARLDVIPVETDLPEERPDLDALTRTLASAANTNTEIERERVRRNGLAFEAKRARDEVADLDGYLTKLREDYEAAVARTEKQQAEALGRAEAYEAETAALSPLGDPVDTTAATQAITAARVTLDRFARKEVRDKLVADFDALKVKSEGYTAAIAERAKARADALAEAEMPVPGLSLARRCDVIPGDESDDLIVVYEGEPFAQASGAQQLRVSMRLAMTANPRLRVMLIKDGSLLDTNGLALVRELAAEGDYQVWLESVGEGDGSGLIMEAGTVRGAPEPERLDPPKRRKAKAEAEPAPAPASEVATTAEVTAADAPKPNGEQFQDFMEGKARGTDTPQARRRPASMREFSTPKPDDLFGGNGQ